MANETFEWLVFGRKIRKSASDRNRILVKNYEKFLYVWPMYHQIFINDGDMTPHI